MHFGQPLGIFLISLNLWSTRATTRYDCRLILDLWCSQATSRYDFLELPNLWCARTTSKYDNQEPMDLWSAQATSRYDNLEPRTTHSWCTQAMTRDVQQTTFSVPEVLPLSKDTHKHWSLHETKMIRVREGLTDSDTTQDDTDC